MNEAPALEKTTASCGECSRGGVILAGVGEIDLLPYGSTFLATKDYKRKILSACYLAARYYAAFMLFSYGFAKVMGAQFTILDSQLTKPMGDVSGFWLTWYYFGYSTLYSALVAWSQIVGATLLCFRRTALLGTLVLFPVMINIVAIDLWVVRFPKNSDALRNAIFVLAVVTVVIWLHIEDLYRFFLKREDPFSIWSGKQSSIIALQCIVVVGMIVYAAHDGYWLANVNNRSPTAIDGAWHKTDSQPVRADIPDWVFFEYNRANMVVFRFADGRAETHDFRVDERDKSLNISKEWLTAGSDVFKGSWDRAGDTMTIRGIWAGSFPVELTLQRKPMPVKDHR